jgi:hypothetical protein
MGGHRNAVTLTNRIADAETEYVTVPHAKTEYVTVTYAKTHDDAGALSGADRDELV